MTTHIDDSLARGLARQMIRQVVKDNKKAARAVGRRLRRITSLPVTPGKKFKILRKNYEALYKNVCVGVCREPGKRIRRQQLFFLASKSVGKNTKENLTLDLLFVDISDCGISDAYYGFVNITQHAIERAIKRLGIRTFQELTDELGNILMYLYMVPPDCSKPTWMPTKSGMVLCGSDTEYDGRPVISIITCVAADMMTKEQLVSWKETVRDMPELFRDKFGERPLGVDANTCSMCA